MIKVIRPVLTTWTHAIYRYQSQTTLDLLNRKAPIEIENDSELENRTFDNTIEWNKALKTYRMRGEEKKALKLFEIGIRKQQFRPDYITYLSMIEICKDLKDLDSGRFIHRLIHNSSTRDNSRIQSLLMDMYMKCRDVNSARDMFDALKQRTVIDYNAMMIAYNNNQQPDRTLVLFNEMREKAQIKANTISYSLYLQACAMLKSIDQGKAMHEEIKQRVSNWMKNKELANQLIAMYIAFEDFSTAEDYFNQIKDPNVQNYVALMNHFNQSSNGNRTLQLYDRMKAQPKIQPDVATYLAVLSAVKQTNNIDRVKQIQADIFKQNLWQNHADVQRALQDVLQTLPQQQSVVQ